MISETSVEESLTAFLSSNGYVLRPLDESHERNFFDCGRDDNMNRWFADTALTWHEERLCRVWVLSEEQDNESVVGFFALSSSHIVPTEIGKPHRSDFTKNKPSVNNLSVSFPAQLLGKFAVSERYQGQNIGKILMLCVYMKHLSVAGLTGAKMLVLEAKENGLVKYYQNEYSFFPSKCEEGSAVKMYKSTKAITEELSSILER